MVYLYIVRHLIVRQEAVLFDIITMIVKGLLLPQNGLAMTPFSSWRTPI